VLSFTIARSEESSRPIGLGRWLGSVREAGDGAFDLLARYSDRSGNQSIGTEGLPIINEFADRASTFCSEVTRQVLNGNSNGHWSNFNALIRPEPLPSELFKISTICLIHFSRTDLHYGITRLRSIELYRSLWIMLL
jgi:hypothetical protein